MAKKGHRQLYLLVCTKCNHQNYITSKNKINTVEKLELNKFCKWCRETLPHKEKAKLK